MILSYPRKYRIYAHSSPNCKINNSGDMMGKMTGYRVVEGNEKGGENKFVFPTLFISPSFFLRKTSYSPHLSGSWVLI
jgi:hypothetical protein